MSNGSHPNATKKAAGGGGFFVLIILAVIFFSMTGRPAGENGQPADPQTNESWLPPEDSEDEAKNNSSQNSATDGWSMDTDATGAAKDNTANQKPGNKKTTEGNWSMEQIPNKDKESDKSSGVDLNLSNPQKSGPPKEKQSDGWNMEGVQNQNAKPKTDSRSGDKGGWEMKGVSPKKSPNK